jgi:2-polyprenyl-3-methyl-5-hydroxy-6-metoxy-1,4-benzoquinol methylase
MVRVTASDTRNGGLARSRGGAVLAWHVRTRITVQQERFTSKCGEMSPCETPLEMKPGKLAALSRRLYRDGPLILRKMQHVRPFICPFDLLLPHLPKTGRVLDIGCGSGLLLGLAAALGGKFAGIGFDMSTRAIRLAQHMGRSYPQLQFMQLPVDADWPSGAFDAVCLVDVIHHVPQRLQREFMLSAAAKVAPGGLFIYKDMAKGPSFGAAANWVHDLLISRQVIHYVPVQLAEKWVNEAGLETIARQETRRMWYPHEIRIFKRV